METASEFLKARAGTTKRGALTGLLDKAPDVPPLKASRRLPTLRYGPTLRLEGTGQ
ncbi:hypothetical protein ABK249_29325 [Neorhizobium sp. Rsf11]|uniref:Uncharacterized protein n=1 Tax=Neorhizobium phenanthreniclasticum TaxID=3157917 RepID=A0ABV0MAU8_9HYPH